MQLDVGREFYFYNPTQMERALGPLNEVLTLSTQSISWMILPTATAARGDLDDATSFFTVLTEWL